MSDVREREADTPARTATVEERITNYLGNGGFFNPELMNHDAVRDLLMDARAEITRLADELAAIIKGRA